MILVHWPVLVALLVFRFYVVVIRVLFRLAGWIVRVAWNLLRRLGVSLVRRLSAARVVSSTSTPVLDHSVSL